MKKLTHIFYLSTLVLVLSPIAVFANTAVPASSTEFDTSPAAQTPPSYVLLTPLPCVGVPNGTTCTGGANGSSQITQIGIQDYLLYVFRLAIALTVFLAVVMTIWGGFKYMTTEAVLGKGEARKTIENAVLGLLLALASYLILYTINPNLVNLSKVAVPKLNVAVNQQIQNDINNLSYQAGEAQVNNARQASNAAATTQQTAQQDMNTIFQQLNDKGCIDANGNDISGGDPNCVALENQYQNDQNTVKNAVGQQNTQAAIASMIQAENALNLGNTHLNSLIPGNGGISINTGSINYSDAQTAIQKINDTYTQALPNIPNGDVNDRQALTNQMTYEEASAVNTIKTNTSLENLAADQYHSLTHYFDVSSDVASANALIQYLKTNPIPQPGDSNSIGLITTPLGTLDPGSTLGQQYASDNQAKITALQNAIRAVGGTPVQ